MTGEGWGVPSEPPVSLPTPENRLLPTELRHEALALQRELEFDFETPGGERGGTPNSGGEGHPNLRNRVGRGTPKLGRRDPQI